MLHNPYNLYNLEAKNKNQKKDFHILSKDSVKNNPYYKFGLFVLNFNLKYLSSIPFSEFSKSFSWSSKSQKEVLTTNKNEHKKIFTYLSSQNNSFKPNQNNIPTNAGKEGDTL